MLRSLYFVESFGEICQSVEAIFELVFRELKQSTRASEGNCEVVAQRIAMEVSRICQESKRIQESGEVTAWAITLARHRLKQCLNYYNLGNRQGRLELHSTLSAIIYRYITPAQIPSSYQARLNLIEDFLQGFYIESWKAFGREAQLPENYRPKTILELAEYMAFVERYAKRRIPLPGRRSQQLIILRAQTFSQQQPPETSVDLESAAEGSSLDSDQNWSAGPIPEVREAMIAAQPEPPEDSLRQNVVTELISYLEERQQNDCVEYFIYRLQDLPANEIENLMNLTPRQRDYLQQRFKYHLIRFSMGSHWELVHQWLEADLDKNLGMTPQQWQSFLGELTPQQQKLLELKQQKVPESAIAQTLGCSTTQVQKQWSKLLETAWEIRNRLVSGISASTDE
ncbi:heterocyst differentiation protein HetZ [Desertifilum sp. FACHB-1129]|uniref:ATPase involved in DNA repair n=2 Tax=Cyanophyceae TaxID=3028117 RepID=A0A1E5QCV6_9CYAN|nr:MULTISPECIES: heterocyst differentiation protein HetZ [Cyanophyceae]MDA0211645.1 heterocyst differentiation protein HetZ [Cyanobacteria bacterium FC1]MDL5045184.1 heterocyst differentiation protein HetZ [Oscillatoria amoena NRMC-F 0135]OEJ72414.1 ATPase involved in DNA repair [Desertifilum tharense IPPAS B-1220]MBD2312152.1 heterocyst differentiation protein HetZ [Desertifilum sp. FACHB-1129]MBD2322186.1 heterocyst differentiation protein HetZ [Desertifilum sp. FACHB-866]